MSLPSQEGSSRNTPTAGEAGGVAHNRAQTSQPTSEIPSSCLKNSYRFVSCKIGGLPHPTHTLKKISFYSQFLPAWMLQEDVMSSVTACIWCLPFGPQVLGPWSGLRKCRDRAEVTVLPVLTVQGSPRLHSLLRPLALAFPAPFTDVCPAHPALPLGLLRCFTPSPPLFMP